MEIRVGDYAVYRGHTFRLIRKANGELRLQADKAIGQELGFKNYIQPELQDKSFLIISVKDLQSAFTIYTYAMYRGHRYQLNGEMEEGKWRIWPNGVDTYEAIGINPRDDSTHFWIEEKELEEVWEERMPIPDLPFEGPVKVNLRNKR